MSTAALSDAISADEHNDITLAAVEGFEVARVELLTRLVESLTTTSFTRDGAFSLTTWLRRRAGFTPTQARQLVRQTGLLKQLPAFGDALRSQATTLAHLDTLTTVATEPRMAHLEEFATQLVEHACNLSVDDYTKVCAYWAQLADDNIASPTTDDSRYLTLAPTLFGELDITGHLTADQATTLTTAINHLNRPDPADAPEGQRSLRQRNADALTDLAHHFLNQPPNSKTPNRTRTTATVVIDWDTYTNPTPEPDPVDLASIRRELLTNGPIPARVAAHLTCDTNIRRLVLDATGQPLNLGRTTPTVTAHQRHTLAIRDQGCVFPTCDRPAHWCDAHHLIPWHQHGPTDLDNLALLCRRHHRLIHRPAWNLQRDPTSGTITATRNDGTTYTRTQTGTVTAERAPPTSENAS